MTAGKVMHVQQNIYPGNSHGGSHGAETTIYDPVVYLLEPEDMTIDREKFTLTTTNSDNSTSSAEINYDKTQIADVENLPSGYTLYEYRLKEKVLLGWWSGDWENATLTVDFDYRIDPAAKTQTYNFRKLIFYKSSLEIAFAGGSETDIYHLNGGKNIGAVVSKEFTVQAASNFSIAASIQIEGEGDDKWYTYDPDDPTNTTAVFTDGATANVRVTVINNSGQDTSDIEVYIPIPKQADANDGKLGDAFLKQVGFDMLVGGVADSPPGWSVQYGQVEKVEYTDAGVPNEIKLKDGTNWGDDYENANMIKLSLSDGGTLEKGEQAQITLKFKATSDTEQTDSMNIFKSWWKYSAGGTAMVDTPQEGAWIYNFGTLLQNGQLSGTVYLDTNRNGIMDNGEKGMSGVVIKAADADNRVYPELRTDENGQYLFKSLPGNKAITLTVINPGSTDPNQSNSYRFSPTGQASTGQIGSDVTANEAGTQATAKLENLGDSGAATVNAGLITPYTIQFSAGDHGNVSPASIKAYEGQTLGDVLNSAPTVTPASNYTHTGWYQDGKTELLTNAQLLTQTVTGDTTYTAQYKPVTYSVTVNGSYADTTGAGDYQEGATVTIHAGTNSGHTFTGWTVTSGGVTLANASTTTTTFTMPAENVTVTANWQKDEPTPAGTITVTPADIIIYMGGKPYEGAVDENGDIISNENAGLPEPGFTVQLPDALSGTPITGLTFKEKGGNRTWTFQPYDGQPGTTVYKLVPAKGQEATRVQFTDPDTGKVIPSDEFIVGLEVNKDFEMELYRGSGDSQVGAIEVEVDGGTKYAVTTESGTLTVRGTTEDVSINPVSTAAPTSGAGAVAQSGTTYTINDSDVQVTDTSGVSLLFDGIINNNGNDRTGQLQSRAESYFQKENISPSSGNRFAYEFKYLDLVDANNGNAWVKASKDVTIYWPIPAGADKTSLKVLHFEDLHRDMTTGQIENEISKCDVELVESTVQGDYVTFAIGSAGFSPFALVWQEKDGGSDPGGSTTYYTIKAEAGDGGSISPSGRVRVARGSNKTFTITPDEGYRIADVLVDGKSVGAVSRYTFENVRSDHTIEAIFKKYASVADPDDTGVSEWLDTNDHRAFLNGYTDGTFGPGQDMTRAEVAQMFYNLLLDKDVSGTAAFTDVPADMWCAEAVNTLASLGIVQGVGDGLYAPDRPITRAEFTVIAMRFADLDTSGENIFSDVSADDWFYTQVVGSIQYGWIQGYADGTFRPNNTITRAEVTAITNRMLGRAADEDYVDRHADALRQFPDVSKTHWAYYNIMEATNAHDYGMDNGVEDWTSLK